MKTIVRNASGLSLYLFNDEVRLTVGPLHIVVGDPVHFIIGDCNESNVTIYAGIDAPSDWAGGKYLYADAKWSLNPDYVDPAQPDPFDINSPQAPA